jgi:hypothetical protein
VILVIRRVDWPFSKLACPRCRDGDNRQSCRIAVKESPRRRIVGERIVLGAVVGKIGGRVKYMSDRLGFHRRAGERLRFLAPDETAGTDPRLGPD